MTGYDFHPEAEIDLNEIWGDIAADNLNAADHVIADIHQALEGLDRDLLGHSVGEHAFVVVEQFTDMPVDLGFGQICRQVHC